MVGVIGGFRARWVSTMRVARRGSRTRPRATPRASRARRRRARAPAAAPGPSACPRARGRSRSAPRRAAGPQERDGVHEEPRAPASVRVSRAPISEGAVSTPEEVSLAHTVTASEGLARAQPFTGGLEVGSRPEGRLDDLDLLPERRASLGEAPRERSRSRRRARAGRRPAGRVYQAGGRQEWTATSCCSSAQERAEPRVQRGDGRLHLRGAWPIIGRASSARISARTSVGPGIQSSGRPLIAQRARVGAALEPSPLVRREEVLQGPRQVQLAHDGVGRRGHRRPLHDPGEAHEHARGPTAPRGRWRRPPPARRVRSAPRRARPRACRRCVRGATRARSRGTCPPRRAARRRRERARRRSRASASGRIAGRSPPDTMCTSLPRECSAATVSRAPGTAVAT